MASPGSSSSANVSQVTDDVDPLAASSTIQPRRDAVQVRPHSPPIATKRPASLRRPDASNIASPPLDDEVRIDTPAPLPWFRKRSGPRRSAGELVAGQGFAGSPRSGWQARQEPTLDRHGDGRDTQGQDGPPEGVRRQP